MQSKRPPRLMIDPRSAAPAVGVPLSPTPPRPARAAQLSRPSIPRAYLFAALCAVCLLIGGGYTALTVLRRGRLPGQGPAVAGRAAQSIETLTSQSVLVFRSLSRERPEGTVAMLPLNA